jgi:hypothetical protein
MGLLVLLLLLAGNLYHWWIFEEGDRGRGGAAYGPLLLVAALLAGLPLVLLAARAGG